MSNTALIQTLEEVACRALPAQITRHYDGWLLRYNGGYTRRANAIYPLYGSSLDINEKIEFCETLYRNQQQPVIFKLTQASQPSDLENRLIDRDYKPGPVTQLQKLALDQAQLPLITTFPGSYRVNAEWFKAYTTLNQVPNKHHDTLREMLLLLRLPAYYAIVRHDNGAVCAVGLAVHDETWVGIFDVVVAEAYRQQGYGKHLIQILLAWGKKQGAKNAYLQVQETNTAARHLYQRLGFQQMYRYWYRELAPVSAAV
jgi:ribosomal protein S18 acetylase RimI-like enzyme